MLFQKQSLTANIIYHAALIGIPYLFLWGYLLQTKRIDLEILMWVGVLLSFNAILLFKFVVGLVKPLRSVGTELHNFANGDFTVRVENPYQGEFKKMLDDVNNAFNSIQNMMEGMLDNTVNIASANFETVAATAKVVFNVEKEEQHIQGISVGVSNIDVRMREIAENVHQSRVAATEMNNEVQTGNQIINETITHMDQIARSVQEAEETVQRLDTASRQIGEITALIRDIAGQTNLLALNAAIEAARAGEQGRGFAVVADEVRKLAERTGSATNEIAGMISSIQSETLVAMETMRRSADQAQEGRGVTTRAGHAFQSILGKIETVSELIDHISAAAEAQKEATAEISRSIAVIAEVATGNTGQAYKAIASIEHTNSVIGNQLRILEQFEIPAKLVLVAKPDHVLWKKRLNEMLLGSTQIRPDELADHRHCRLGKWYYSEGQARFGNNADFRAIEEPHARLHEVARKVVELYEQGNKTEAQKMIDGIHPYTEGVISGLDKLRNLLMKEIGRAHV